MMAKRHKSLDEERKAWYSAELKRAETQSHKDCITKCYGPNASVNLKRGTCPWCGERQAQIWVLNSDKFDGIEVERSSDQRCVNVKARVCLTCGRVELTDSKPER